jgi:hypothetical protein
VTDLNMMMREQARAGLMAHHDKAVTDGDTEAARKIMADIVKLEVSTAPKAPPFGDTEIKAALETKAPWFGTDPKKTAKAHEFGKALTLSKFASAEAFAEALIKAVDDEFKPPAKTEDDEELDEDVDPDGEQDPPAKPKKTDGPKDSDTAGAGTTRAKSGPWTKLSDAPREVQADVKRQADKFVSAKATKEQRESFISKALESHYQAHQRAKGKK